MRKRTLIIISLVSVVLPFFSCSREPLPVVQEEDGERTLPMVLAGGVTAFDDATKAPAEFSFSNENVVYLRLTDPRDASHPLIGRATYDGSWKFTYQGSYDYLSSGNVEAYLFEKNYSKERSVLNITYRTPIYGTENGSFSIADDTLKINASLKPVTGRVTFINEEGNTSYINRLSGISYYSNFDIDNFSFSSTSSPIDYGWMDYGDYIYGFLTNAGYPILCYPSDGRYFVTTAYGDFLKKGSSGYFRLPDDNNSNGWLKCNQSIGLGTNWRSIWFLCIGAGTYIMGDTENNPPHQVIITQPVLIMQSEVSKDFWQYVTEDNEYGYEDSAVTGKSFDQIQTFIEELNNKWPEYSFRLPTEAEWELAAKGGILFYSDYRFSGSNSTNDCAYLFTDESHDETNPFNYWINRRIANNLGIFDMSGNAAELCSDWYDDSCTYHVVRGGSAFDFDKKERLTVTHRCSEADYPADQIGFRLVMEVTPFTFD